MKNLAIFASGSGSNAENIHDYFKDDSDVNISVILTNSSSAYVIERAKRLGIPYEVFDRPLFKDGDAFLALLKKYDANFIVLAGFLWLIPSYLVEAFPNAIVNIHPALLPKYGGKGMYGQHVHEAVVANSETESGITIHFVNENYDEGEHVYQAKVEVEPDDSADDVAKKVHQLEYTHFPRVIAEILKEA